VNLARAIHAASIGDPNFVPRAADVISMSLGGAPNRAIVDALDTASRHNVIVLAAAGNDVPKREVGFPARYEYVIAVAGVNARSTPWTGSSRGPAVAFAAPGENVWTAREFFEDDTAHHCVQMGTGTSYAVATAAGVAALWVSKHRADLRGRSNLSELFRSLARQTARTPRGWDPDKFGPGIIDADALLRHEIPAPTASVRRTCPDHLALQSIFGDRDPDGAATLLGGDRHEVDCSGSGAGDEIAYWFATDAATMEAFASFFVSDDHTWGMRRLRRTLMDGPLTESTRAALAAATEHGGRHTHEDAPAEKTP
jgi:hypothetical protein